MFEHNSRNDPEFFEDPAEFERQLQILIQEGGGRTVEQVVHLNATSADHKPIEELVEAA
jgi:hypothetical protein